MLNNQSLNFGEDESLHIQSPIYNPNGNFNTIKSKGYHNTQPFNSGKYVNIVYRHSTSGKLVVNPQFQNYMSLDASNPNMINASFLGPKQIGKSFLVDNLLSLQSGQVRRLMSKSHNQLLNMPSFISNTHQGDRITYLDNNGDPSPSMFLWLYFMSSVMVYNLSPNNYNEEAGLLECLVFVHNNLQQENNDQIRPQLVLVRRDTGRKEVFDIELVRKIEQFELFQPQIVILHMPYPGTKDIMAKQLLDIPVNQLDRNFLNEVSKLHQIIRSAKPKKVNGNVINSQNFRLAVQPLTKSINNQQSLSTKRIWNQVNEALSINFYNQYLKSYSEELQRQFANEQPYDKYTIYKKLSKIKKRTNKKMQKYNTMPDEPIFKKYQQKLNETIKNKETLVKGVNQAKSRQIHQQSYNNLFEKINPSNCGQLIDLYCKTKLDDQKTEVLLQNFEKVMKAKAAMNAPIPVASVAPINPVRISKKKQSAEVIAINNQLRQLEKMLVEKSKVSTVKNTNVDFFKTSVMNKRAQLQSLKSEYQNLANQPHFILSGQNKNEQLMELEQQRVRLNNHINEYDRKIEMLRKQKESNLKETAFKLQQELRQEENQLRAMQNKNSQQVAYRSKINEAGKSTKKTCCNIM